jgi:3-deoxy-D-manno-octulosonate 8-phosphate phosphatase (KDO 8-P phosphatase)
VDTLLERARRIRLLALDVDGVLTDGRLYLSPAGEELKVFHVRDGSGLVAVQRAGITVAIVSGRDSAAVSRRAAELGIRHVRQGVADKGGELDRLLAELAIEPAEAAHWTTAAPGGRGAVREICDLLLSARAP